MCSYKLVHIVRRSSFFICVFIQASAKYVGTNAQLFFRSNMSFRDQFLICTRFLGELWWKYIVMCSWFFHHNQWGTISLEIFSKFWSIHINVSFVTLCTTSILDPVSRLNKVNHLRCGIYTRYHKIVDMTSWRSTSSL